MSLLRATGERVYSYPKITIDKGMDNPAMVDYYFRIMAKNKFYFRRIARKALSLKPDARNIADIGTGPGFLAVELARITGKEIKAIDISPNMLAKAKEYAIKSKVRLETIESSCESMPLEDRSLDLVTSSNLIHCLADPLPYFIELKRVLKPGGFALIVGYRRDTWRIFRMIGDLHTRAQENKPMDGMGAVLDASFTGNELEEFIEKAGFDDFSIKAGILFLQAILRH